MTKEQIDQLAAKRYPIGDNVSDNDRDTLEMFRRIYSEGLIKASELLYTEEQVKHIISTVRKGTNTNYKDIVRAAYINNKLSSAIEEEICQKLLQSIKQQ